VSDWRFYPICKRCGHGAGSHTTTLCASFTGMQTDLQGTPLPETRKYCDCPGWKRDTDWGTDAIEEQK
jgi:hypothetical protein